jgi:hypothetical protein
VTAIFGSSLLGSLFEPFLEVAIIGVLSTAYAQVRAGMID